MMTWTRELESVFASQYIFISYLFQVITLSLYRLDFFFQFQGCVSEGDMIKITTVI